MIVVCPEHSAEAAALLHRALDLVETGNAAEAARAFRAVIALDPACAEAYHGLVRALYEAGHPEQSIAAALALTTVTPHDPLAHTALSIALQRGGHIAEAEAAAAKARVLEWKMQLEEPAKE